MSIWISTESIGYDIDDSDAEDRLAGRVWSYANGFSNHYPDGDIEQPSTIELAYIPGYCVPGHHDDGGYPNRGEWLRIGFYGWKHNHHDPATIQGRSDTTLVLDAEAVRSLRDQLEAWLAKPELRACSTDHDAHNRSV